MGQLYMFHLFRRLGISFPPTEYSGDGLSYYVNHHFDRPEDIARAEMFLAAYAPADMTGQFINLFGANDHSGHAPSIIT